MPRKIFQIPLQEAGSISEMIYFLQRKLIPLVIWSNRDDGNKIVSWGLITAASSTSFTISAEGFFANDGEGVFIYAPGPEVAAKLKVLNASLGQYTFDLPIEFKFFAAFDAQISPVKNVTSTMSKAILALFERTPFQTEISMTPEEMMDRMMEVKTVSEKMGELLVIVSSKQATQVAPTAPPVVDANGVKVEVENENKFAHLRAAPRSKPKADQIITIRRKKASPEGDEDFLLYDLSQGGMAFRIYDISQFKVGDKVYVVAVGGKPSVQMLVGIIRSIRALPDEISEFKVGVQFVKEY